MATDTDLLRSTADLVDIASESFGEGPIVARIEDELGGHPHLVTHRVGDNLVAHTELGRRHRVLLGGHTDTVPANGNESARIEGETLWGVGSADMKGGLAVMLELARQHRDPPVDLTYVFYAREEVAAEHSGLGELVAQQPDLLSADVAILGEPTGGDIEAGCQGSVRLRVTLRGERAHTARAWMGRNAVHRLGALLAALERYQPRQPVIDGCEFHEALLAVSVRGGVAGNVVPDTAVLEIAHRFAPDRDATVAEAHVREVIAPFVEAGDSIEVTDVADAAMPAISHPFVAEMIERDGLEVRAKLGWTDVARFAALGIPAVNLGPGQPTLAHTAGEHVERSSIEKAYRVLDAAIHKGY